MTPNYKPSEIPEGVYERKICALQGRVYALNLCAFYVQKGIATM